MEIQEGANQLFVGDESNPVHRSSLKKWMKIHWKLLIQRYLNPCKEKVLGES